MHNKIFKKLGLLILDSRFIFLATSLYYLTVSLNKGGLWADELSLMSDVLLSNTWADLIQQLKFEVHAPGTWLVTYGLAKLSLTSEFMLRLPSVFIGALGVTAFVRLASFHLNRLWLCLFWFLLLSLPPLSWHASEVRPHIFLFGLGSLILLFLHQAELSTDISAFRRHLKKAGVVFAISVWFHFAAFFMLIGVFVPFVVWNRERIFSDQLRYSIKLQIIFYFSIAAAAAYAVFLFYSNVQSVLWGPHNSLLRFIQFTSSSLLYYTSHLWLSKLSGLCALAVLLALALKRIPSSLRSLGLIYFLSLALLLLIEYFGYPLSRTKYSLYLIPVLTLLFLKILSEFKVNKLLALIPVAFVVLNAMNTEYIRTPFTREMVQKSKDFLNQDTRNKLILIGYKRDLLYYLRNLNVEPYQMIDCGQKSQCLVEFMQTLSADQVLLLYYKTKLYDDFRPFMTSKIIIKDHFGKLVKIKAIMNNFEASPDPTETKDEIDRFSP